MEYVVLDVYGLDSETVEWLNMGLHEPESIYSAYKWTSRFFDCCVIMLIQTAYKIYKRCRDNHLGSERVISHAELNASIIYDLLHNNNWRR